MKQVSSSSHFEQRLRFSPDLPAHAMIDENLTQHFCGARLNACTAYLQGSKQFHFFGGVHDAIDHSTRFILGLGDICLC